MARKPVNDKVHDAITMRGVDLIRLANGESGALVSGVMASADEKIAGRLTMITEPSALTRKQRLAVEARLIQILDIQNRGLRGRLSAYVGTLSANEAEFAGGLLTKTYKPLGLTPKVTSGGAGLARARRIPILGATMAQSLTRFIRGDKERVLATFRRGVSDGLQTSTLVRSVVGTKSLRLLDGVRQVSRRAIDGLVRTATTHVTAAVREVMYESNPDLIREERWVATLDSITCPICRALDGKLFPVGEGTRPPAHFQCRCARMPIVPGLRALPTDDEMFLPSTVKESFDGKGPQVLTYQRWLQGQTATVQANILGPTRLKLFNEGATMRSFVNDRNTILTIPELKRRMPSIFDAAGLDDDD